MLLPKQQAQAKAWRLFIVSGSLTWFRRPRLASFTSTTIVETIHPLVTSQPIWLRFHPNVRRREFSSTQFFGVSNGPRHIAIGVAFGDGLTAVLGLLSFGERQFNLGLTLLEVQLERNHRVRLSARLVQPVVEFVSVRQQLAPAIGVVTAETG